MNIADRIISRFKSPDVIKFSEKDDFKDMKSWVSTGSPILEANLGILGYPTGVIEIAGMSRSGKTTLALVGMANFLSREENGVAIILSSENRDNKHYAKKLGIPVDKVIIIKIRFVEDMFMKVKKVIDDAKEIFKAEKLGDPKFYFMWDSLGATLSKAELDTMEANTVAMEKKMEKGEELEKLQHAQMASFAKSAKMFAKFLLAEMYNSTIHFIMLNHVHDQMGGTGGKKSGGGGWVEFLPCIRLRTSLIAHEKVDEEEVAQITEVKIVKNDFGSRKKTHIEILLGNGLVLSKEDIAYGVERGIIKKEGALKHTYMKVSWKSKRTFYELYNPNKPEIKFMNLLVNRIAKERHKDILELRNE